MSSPSVPGWRVRIRAAGLLAAVTAADQAVKLIVAHYIPLGASAPLIPGVLALTQVRNPGIAFGLRAVISPLLPAAVALVVFFLLFSNKARWSGTPVGRTALALAGGGALGNLIDRLRVGAVIDYLDLQIWPVFNLADAAVTAGAALLILALVRGNR